MPVKPQPRCPGLDGQRCGVRAETRGRCRQHERERLAARGSKADRGYDYSWQQLSKQAIADQPWCTDCGAVEDLTTDHVIPGDRRRLEVVCRPCNSSRRLRQRRRP